MLDQLIKMIKEASAVLGLSTANKEQALTAAYQIEQKDYLGYEELIQLNERLPGIIPALCEQMRIDTSELSYRLEQGLIPADEAFIELGLTIRNKFLTNSSNG